MQYRNLTRAFVFSKVVKKYNKQNNADIQRRIIYVLYCILVLGGKDDYISLRKIQDTLNACNLGDDYRSISNLITKCLDSGYLIGNMLNRRRLWYKLSIAGVNLINEFEDRIRKERWNR